MKNYCVYSPLMTKFDDSGVDPPEDFACSVFEWADNKRAAIIAALKRTEFKDWLQQCRSDNTNPFIGVKAEGMGDQDL